MDPCATLVDARRAVVYAAVRAACAEAGCAEPQVPAVQGVVASGDHDVTRYAELTHLVGEDATRYALVRTRANRPVRLDTAQWARRDEANPLWRVRYVRVRALLCLRTAAAYDAYPTTGDHDVSGYRELAEVVDAVPAVFETAAKYGEPHRIAYHFERRVAVMFAPLAASLLTLPSGIRDTAACDVRRAYGCELALAARCADAVATALAVLGVAAPDRL